MTARRAAGLRIAIVGATGLVGERLLELLDERCTPVAELRLLARTGRGRTVSFRGRTHPVEPVEGCDLSDSDLVLFSAGTEASLEHAERIAAQGPHVIDNSNAFRMEESVPLVVPQVNPEALDQLGERRLISNPNCSTIPIVRVLHALAEFGPNGMVVSTYQAVSGAGHAGLEALRETGSEEGGIETFGRPIRGNVIPLIDAVAENGESIEETKMREETRKILGGSSIRVSTSCVRVPVANCHSATVCIDFNVPPDLSVVGSRLRDASEIVLHENFPTPLEVDGSNEVHVGRVRIDPERPTRLLCWVVSDNTRVGAALNAVQIMERLRPRLAPSRRTEAVA